MGDAAEAEEYFTFICYAAAPIFYIIEIPMDFL